MLYRPVKFYKLSFGRSLYVNVVCQQTNFPYLFQVMPRLFEFKKDRGEDSSTTNSPPPSLKDDSPPPRQSAFTLVASTARGELLNPLLPVACPPYIWPPLHGLFLPYSPALHRPPQAFSPERAGSIDAGYTPEKAKIGKHSQSSSQNYTLSAFSNETKFGVIV